MPVLVALGVVIGAVWALQRTLIYLPDRSAPPAAADVVPAGRDVTLRTADGLDLGAWHVPASPGCDATVLVAQGNGGNRTHRVGLVRALSERGFGVLAFDYRGYGGNAGRPTERGLAADARAARAYLLDASVVPESIVYLGESLGAAVVAELATQHPPAAMVLRSPFTSLADAGRAAYGVPVGWLLRDRYPVVEHVGAIPAAAVSVAVVHGSADTIVPAALSREVARAARQAGHDVVEVEVEGANHNDAELAEGPALLEAVVEAAGRSGLTGCG